MAKLLGRSSRNYLRRHSGQLALALAGIALGVAVVVAIDLALDSAMRSFELAGEALSGRATHTIGAGDGGLDETLYTRLRVEQAIHNLAPVIREYVALADNPDERYTLYGVDPFIEKSFRSVWQAQVDVGTARALLQKLLTLPDSILISKRSAKRLGLEINSRFSLLTDRGVHPVQVIGLIDPPHAVSAELLDRVIIADLATAQELTGMYGKLSAIEWMQPENTDPAPILAEMRTVLPGNIQITEASSQAKAVRQMTDAFAVNLRALGLLSLLVGLFLIYNAMMFLVLQRRSLIGCLRALGVTRREIFTLVISEALGLATIGTVLGIAAGTVIGRLLLSSVSETISTVYFPVGPSALIVETPQLIKALLLGIVASVLAVLAPAYEATRLSPIAALRRSQLETGARRLMQLSALAGSSAIISGLAITVFSAASVRLGLAGIIVLLFGFALLTPAAALWLLPALQCLCKKKWGVIGTLPLRLVTAEISRTGVAMAALMVAVAATIGMDLMIASFRRTVSDWIQTSLQGDLYIAVSGNLAAAGKARQDLELKSALASLPDVEMLSSVLRTQLPTSAGPVPAAVFELNPRSRAGFIVLDGAGDVWERFEREQGVWVTEAFAYHHQVGVGDELTLLAPQGPVIFKVIAVYADYTGDRGHIAMSRRQYLRHWPDLGFTGVGVYAMTHADLTRLEREIRLKLSARQTVKSARAIYEASMAVFEQTFAITEILRGLASGIAVIGVFGALTSLQFERARQIGILRSIGLTPAQICRLIVSETGLMGLSAGLIALPVGYLLAYQLIFVVYRRSFGWTLAFHFDPAVLLQGLFLAIAAALLAGLWPAWKMAHGNPAEALRTE